MIIVINKEIKFSSKKQEIKTLKLLFPQQLTRIVHPSQLLFSLTVLFLHLVHTKAHQGM